MSSEHNKRHRNTDTSTTIYIRSVTLVELRKLGFKPVSLSSDHKPAGSWTRIYDDPNYWAIKGLINSSSKFENVATVFCKTHVKDCMILVVIAANFDRLSMDQKEQLLKHYYKNYILAEAKEELLYKIMFTVI